MCDVAHLTPTTFECKGKGDPNLKNSLSVAFELGFSIYAKYRKVYLTQINAPSITARIKFKIENTIQQY